jgi:hypothetical protein
VGDVMSETSMQTAGRVVKGCLVVGFLAALAWGFYEHRNDPPPVSTPTPARTEPNKPIDVIIGQFYTDFKVNAQTCGEPTPPVVWAFLKEAEQKHGMNQQAVDAELQKLQNDVNQVGVVRMCNALGAANRVLVLSIPYITKDW